MKPAAFHAELAALLPRLRRFARVIVWRREDADALVQTALARALARSGQWQAGTRLDSWMFRIIKNAWVDEVRGRLGRERAPGLPAQDEHAAEASAEFPQQNMGQQDMSIVRAVAMLSDDDRLVIGLVLADGLPYKDAAEVLDLPVATLASRLLRAREALQSLLSDQARTVP
jgi:RNA polymerase sigma factor (sigma-70 family)